MSEGEKEKGSARNSLTGRSTSERDVLVFGFFLALSFIFWYLNGLSQEIENQVKYPVRYVNPPRNSVLTGNLPARLEMDLRGPGYSLLKLRLSGSRAPVVVDMERLDLKTLPAKDGNNLKYVLSSSLTESFHKQLRADFDILKISPDTLFFSFDRLETRLVPVYPDLQITTGKEFFVRGEPQANPDSVYVTGPLPIIDTIRFVKTRAKKYSAVSQSFTVSLPLAGSRDYEVSERKVRVSVQVEQYTEARIDLPVRLLNLPDSIEIKLFPDGINLRVLVAVSDYKGIFESNIQAVVDLSAVNLQTAEKLPVSIINVPAYARSLMYSPQEIDFIIESRNR
ncbi:MAG: YbbR-like domain-containing protein [Bacteroidales bacterium]|nr:YbbR-like domain-containing protein [Bacteroidales bacterium]